MSRNIKNRNKSLRPVMKKRGEGEAEREAEGEVITSLAQDQPLQKENGLCKAGVERVTWS